VRLRWVTIDFFEHKENYDMNTKTMLTFCATFTSVALYAQAPIAGQAGSATTARAQSPAKIVNAKSTPDAAPAAEKVEASSKDAIKIGVINQLTFQGPAEFLAAEDVAGLLKPLLCDGTEKTVGDLKAALVDAKNTLVARGYYLVTILPASASAYDAGTQTLDLAVDPGRFGKIAIDRDENAGNWYSDEQILKRLKFVKEGEPFNYNTLRQALRAINTHPDLTANTHLTLRKEANATNAPAATGARYIDTELTVDDSLPLHAMLDLNNYAMEELDYWQMLLTVEYLNLTGADDTLAISPGVTLNGDMWSIASSYRRPFDFLRGGAWSVYGGYSDMDCDKILPRLDLEGIGGFAGLNTSWNLIDTAARNFAFNAGVQWRYLKDRYDAYSENLQNRDLSIVPLTVGFSYADKRRDALGGYDSAFIGQTVNLYGDTEKFEKYSESSESHYTVMRANWSRLQPVYGPEVDGEEWRCWNLFGKLEGQWSQDHTLISAERLAYGGYNCLRGYRTRGYLGDNGVYGTAELRTPVWCDPVTSLFLSREGQSALERVQFLVFSDFGYLNYNTSYPNMDQDEFLWSAGFGLRAGLTRYLSLNFDCAFPLTNGYASDKDRDLELYFSIRMQY